MSDLLAKCDWNNDELRVELPKWPEVVTVWVNGKAMPYVPVVNDSKCDTCEAMLDCDECLRADASHKELRGLQAENDKLRELVRDAWGNGHPDRSCGDCDIRDECHDDIERLRKDGVLRFSRCLFELRIEDRMRELGIEVE